MRYLLLAVMLGGCGRFSFDPLPADDVDASNRGGVTTDGLQQNCMTDDFDAGGGPLWTTFTTTAGFDAMFVGGEVAITLAPNTPGAAGIQTLSTYDFTGGSVSIEAPAVPTSVGDVESYLLAYWDPAHAYGLGYDNGNFRMGRRFNGANIDMSYPYDPVGDRWWRFEHHSPTNTIEFFTSADGRTWASRFSIDATAPITQLTIAVGGDEYANGVATPGTPRFDNFELCLP